MEAILNQLGLNEKETKFYLSLLEKKPLTASGIAKLTGESRTNTYMVLEELEKIGLVTADDTEPIRRYNVAPPDKLQELLEQKEQRLKSTQQSLNTVMQELRSLYTLGQHKPGVTYLEGVEGYKKMLEGCTQSSEEILTFGCDFIPKTPGYEAVLLKGLAKRRVRDIRTRMLFHKPAQEWVDLERFAKRGQEIRFWGQEPFRGEITIYEDKLILTVYEPSLINVIVTNSIIANTFKAIFNQIWCEAEPIPQGTA